MNNEIANPVVTNSLQSTIMVIGAVLIGVGLLFAVGSFLNDRRRNKRINKTKKNKKHKSFSFKSVIEEEMKEEKIEQIIKIKNQKKFNSIEANQKQRDDSRELWKLKKEQEKRNR